MNGEESRPEALQAYLDSIWSEPWPRSVDEMEPDLELMLSYAFDLFGFADGSRAPRGTLGGPGLDKMRDSLLQVVGPMLKPNERELLEIPIEFARVPFIDAAHIFDRQSDRRWIVLNLKLFGALYAVNDRFLQLLSIGRSGASGSDLLDVALRFPDLISRLFLGTFQDDQPWMFRMETRIRPALRGYVWAHTSMQQIFLLLHELGHAHHEHGQAGATTINQRVAAWRSGESQRRQEIKADRFAAQHMAAGPWPDRYAAPRETAIFSLFEFFEGLELLRKMERYSPGPQPEPRKRFRNIAKEIDRGIYRQYRSGFNENREVLDDVFTAWQLSQ